MSPEQISRAAWHKSARSGGNGNCVEVGAVDDVVGIRDTKAKGQGPVLAVSRPVFRSFLAGIRAGDFS